MNQVSKSSYILPIVSSLGIGTAVAFLVFTLVKAVESGPAEKSKTFSRLHDEELGVTCYTIKPKPGLDGIALSCLPDNQLNPRK